MIELIEFVEDRIKNLTELREAYQEEDDYNLDDYMAGAIDAYDVIRMKLEDINA